MEALWKDEYRTGIDKIDGQHQLLFEKIENLLEIARSGDEEKSRKEALKLLDFLVDYTIFHFETEESLLRDRGYRSYAEHIKIHEDFKNTILAYKKLLSRRFSTKTLKKFIGVLITWLVNHVCVCDRKIIRNIPIKSMESFSDTGSYLKNVAHRLLTRLYGIPIQETRSNIYMGHVDGDVILRTLVTGSSRHLILYGMSDRLARELYHKISGMILTNIYSMDEVEKSAVMEIGDIISTYAISGIETMREQGMQFKSDLYLYEYDDTEYNISNSVGLEIITDYGKMDVLYSPID